MTTPSEYRNQGTHKPRGNASVAPDHDDTTVEQTQPDGELSHQRPTGLKAFARGLLRPHNRN